MEIIRLDPEEWPLYKAIRLEALRNEPQAFGASLSSVEAHPDEIWRSRLATAQSSPTNLLLFARDEGRAIGMIGSYYDAGKDSLDVVSFYVAPEARGRGVGRALLKGLLEALAEYELGLVVNEDQEAAVSLYRDAGFEIVRNHEGHRSDGRPRRELVMIRRVKGN